MKLENQISTLLRKQIKNTEVVDFLTERLLRGSINGLELEARHPHEWLSRFKYGLVWLNADDYSRALVRALWLAPKFAATDFGTARQRDFAQVWTDTARGFLGEFALKKFLKLKFGIDIHLERRRGQLEKFLRSDIKVRDTKTGKLRDAKRPVSVKTTKFNGKWLDVAGAQLRLSEIFLLVKIGVSRFHFSAFLKDVSFLRDKLFSRARDLGELSEKDAGKLWKETPDFNAIPAYVAGFIEKRGLKLPIDEIQARVAGRTNRRIEVSSGVGLFSLKAVRNHRIVKQLDPDGDLPIAIRPIIKSLSEAKHFLAHSGALKFGPNAWHHFVKTAI